MNEIEQNIEQRIAELDNEIARLSVESKRLKHGLCVIRGQCGVADDQEHLRCSLHVGHVGKHSDGQWSWK